LLGSRSGHVLREQTSSKDGAATVGSAVASGGGGGGKLLSTGVSLQVAEEAGPAGVASRLLADGLEDGIVRNDGGVS